MQTVRELLKIKGDTVYSIKASQTVYDALLLLAEKNIGALLVMEEKRPVGILSERDYARKVMLQGAASLDIPVKKIMTERIVYVKPEQDIEECLGIMTEQHIRHLPVFEDDKVIGFLSIGDLVKATLEKKERMIQELTGSK